MSELGSYVYGVARRVDPTTVAGLSGVAGSPVRTVAHGALSALVSTVDLTEFGEPGLRHNLENLDWLAATARAHHAVLAAVGLDGAVIPLRLATIYRDDDGVRAVLAERGATFDATLRRVQGRTEWGLKAYLDPGKRCAPSVASSAGGDPDPDEPEVDDPGVNDPAALSPGTAYLRRRRARRRDSAELWHAAGQRAEAIHRAVSAAAEAARRHPPQPGGLTGETCEMVLNGAYLLAGADRAPLELALEQALHRAGGSWPLRVQWTGPWLPYSFVDQEPEP